MQENTPTPTKDLYFPKYTVAAKKATLKRVWEEIEKGLSKTKALQIVGCSEQSYYRWMGKYFPRHKHGSQKPSKRKSKQDSVITQVVSKPKNKHDSLLTEITQVFEERDRYRQALELIQKELDGLSRRTKR